MPWISFYGLTSSFCRIFKSNVYSTVFCYLYSVVYFISISGKKLARSIFEKSLMTWKKRRKKKQQQINRPYVHSTLFRGTFGINFFSFTFIFLDCERSDSQKKWIEIKWTLNRCVCIWKRDRGILIVFIFIVAWLLPMWIHISWT